MKNILLIILLFFAGIACKAQTIPVEGIEEYLVENNLPSVPDGAWIRDVNGLFDKFIGTWEVTHNNHIYTFYIIKKSVVSQSVQIDKLYMKYLITNLNGGVIVDTRDEVGNSIFGTRFSDNLDNYVFAFSGEQRKCNNKGKMYLSYISSPGSFIQQIEIAAYYNQGVVGYDEECEGLVMEDEPLFPLTNRLTLTKQ